MQIDCSMQFCYITISLHFQQPGVYVCLLRVLYMTDSGYLMVLSCSQLAMAWEHWSGQNPGGSSAPEQQSQLPSSTCEVGSMPPSGHANMAPWAAQAEVPTNHCLTHHTSSWLT